MQIANRHLDSPLCLRIDVHRLAPLYLGFGLPIITAAMRICDMAERQGWKKSAGRSRSARECTARSHPLLPVENQQSDIAASRWAAGSQVPSVEDKLFCKPYPSPASLTGSGQQTEMAVSYRKQTSALFLTGARIDIWKCRFARNLFD